jgi:hypothetical protein
MSAEPDQTRILSVDDSEPRGRGRSALLYSSPTICDQPQRRPEYNWLVN